MSPGRRSHFPSGWRRTTPDDGPWRINDQSRFARRHASDRLLQELCDQVGAGLDPIIDAQRERRPGVARFEDGFPLGWKIGFDARDPPTWIGPTRNGITP